MTWRDRLRPFGLWTGSQQWPDDLGAVKDAAAEVEALGFGALWFGTSELPLAVHEAVLAATSRLVVATGIINVWTNPAEAVARRFNELTSAYPGRLLLGLGAGHAQLLEPAGIEYVKPYRKVADYLDQLSSGATPVPSDDIVLAALRPKMLRLAAERTAGAHPYLMPPEHTASARAVLGPEPLLIPEHKVVVDPNADEARRIARQRLAYYLVLPNYTRILEDYGLSEGDLSDGGSDRFVDQAVAWGDTASIRSRLEAHLKAGADHVVVQVLGHGPAEQLPISEWRAVAEALALPRHP